MEIIIDLNKSVDENAGTYFELAKKAKKKLEGAKEALEDSKKKLSQLQQQEDKFLQEEEKKLTQKEIKREWYEKFHWFISSEGFLCVGGKDATSNEIVIKKHMEEKDLVFHTEMPGSPFFLIKNGKEAGEATLQETAQATAIYSKAWKAGLSSAQVFSILPEQVTKEAKAGEFMGKGSFMTYGKRNYYTVNLVCAIGLVKSRIIGGPVEAIKKQTSTFVLVIPGGIKKSELGKRIKHNLKGGDLDEIIKFLPGEGELKR